MTFSRVGIGTFILSHLSTNKYTCYPHVQQCLHPLGEFYLSLSPSHISVVLSLEHLEICENKPTYVEQV
jgi:hypothetical protein